MTTTTAADPSPRPGRTAAVLAWLTPVRCRVVFAALMAFNLVVSWRFLTHDCPIDLAGDEAQYWTWSRHLAYGYYSKGPLVAWLIRASCSILGDTMPGVRAPALLLAVGTACCTYWLTLKLFASDRLALGAVLLGAIVPMFAAGGTLMTIDPPMFFCWAVATCLAAKGLFDRRRWAWPAAGLVIGVGALAKYGALLWLPLVLVALAVDPKGRRWLFRPWPWLMVVVAVACLAPPVWWNAHNHWVTYAHVAAQVGGEPSRLWHVPVELASFAATQAAAVNPALCVFVVGGAIHALTATDERRRQLRFLLVIGGGFWLVCLADVARAKVQPNWPAPAYFTLLILAAHFVATRWHGTWKPWRGWFWGAVAFGLIASFLIHDATRLYPAVRWVNRTFPRHDGTGRDRLTAKNVDPAVKLRGVKSTFAPAVDAELRKLSPGAIVICEDYMDAAQLEFYLAGQPPTFFAGSYWTDPKVRRRWTQFDLWPDRRLYNRPDLFNADAVYVGFAGYAPLRESFESVTKLPDVVVTTDGLEVRRWQVYACRKFKGMPRPAGPGPR